MEVDLLNEIGPYGVHQADVIQEIGIEFSVPAGGVVDILLSYVIRNQRYMQVVDSFVIKEAACCDVRGEGDICFTEVFFILIRFIIGIIPIIPIIYIGCKVLDLIGAKAGIQVPLQAFQYMEPGL